MVQEELTKATIAGLPTPAKGTQAYAAGDSLYLEVDSKGNRRWILRTSVYGRRTRRGLGSWPDVSPSDAKKAAARMVRDLQRGRLTVQTQQERRGVDVPTFAQAMERVIASKRPEWKNWKHAGQWRSTLQTYAVPVLGDKTVDQIGPVDVAAVLEPIWREKRETASRVRQRVEAVMHWAVAAGYIVVNPAGRETMKALLGKPVVKVIHHRALPYGEVPAALRKVELSTSYALTKLALRLLALTATRSGEVRGMRWAEVDWESATWEIPADRMKAGEAHRVPMSDQVEALLREAWEYSGGGELVFPAPRSGDVMSDMVFTQLLRRLEIPAVPHGFRSSFRVWAAEKSGAPWAVCEAALAHRVGNATELAYMRSDLLEERRGLMEQWADFCTG